MTATDYDLSTLGNYHAEHGNLPLSDELIATAEWFEGWHLCYLDWSREVWDDWIGGVPCQDPAKNAFHVGHLAWVMERHRQWIGPPLLLDGLRVVDGNHRLRAVQWLAARGIVIEAPVKQAEETA